MNCTPRLFSDDTCLIFEASNPIYLQNLINSELNKVDTWCCSNKLTVNPSKSNINFISPKLLQNSNDNYNITFANSFIATLPNSKYLGVIIHNKLSFYERIKLLESIISCSVGILTKLKSFILQQTLLQLYYSLVHSHLTYGITIWDSTHTMYLQKHQNLQNRALKVVCNVPFLSSAKPFYKKLNIITIHDTFKPKIATFVYNCNKTLNPTPFLNYFKKKHQVSTGTLDNQKTRTTYIFLNIVQIDCKGI